MGVAMGRMFTAVMVLVGLLALPQAAEAPTYVVIRGCELTAETATSNNRREIQYFACGMWVSFALIPESTPELRLDELVGGKYDIILRRVGP